MEAGEFHDCISDKRLLVSGAVEQPDPKIEDSWLREQLIRELKAVRDKVLDTKL